MFTYKFFFFLKYCQLMLNMENIQQYPEGQSFEVRKYKFFIFRQNVAHFSRRA